MSYSADLIREGFASGWQACVETRAGRAEILLTAPSGTQHKVEGPYTDPGQLLVEVEKIMQSDAITQQHVRRLTTYGAPEFREKPVFVTQPADRLAGYLHTCELARRFLKSVSAMFDGDGAWKLTDLEGARELAEAVGFDIPASSEALLNEESRERGTDQP